MKESFQYTKTISNCLKEDNDMSSVPLMTLHNSKRGSDEIHDSDQMSEEEDDPLESVLARMKYRPQNYRPQDFWSSLMFLGVTCFVIGFVVSYILFLSIDQNSRHSQTIEHNVNPEIASTFLQEISAASISKFIRNLSTSRNDSQDSTALKLRQYFLGFGFDSVSPIKPTEVTLSYYDINRRNLVMVVDENGGKRIELSRITDHIYSAGSEVQGFPVSTTVKGTVVYVNFGRNSDYKYLESLDVGINNRILLARLGKVPPVELVHRCFEKGAVGVILFADPQQYPDGKNRDIPFLLPSQLGMLQKMHGNPAMEGTNGTGCIPLQSISAQDAKYILTEMSSNDPSPESWRGSMSISYQTGPGFSTDKWELKMEVNMFNLKNTYYSVTGTLRGSHEPDRYVLLGSSPGSLFGNDTLIATASMMEVARVFSVLNSDRGWRPRRSVVFCSWGFKSVDGIVSSVPLNQEWGHSMHQRAVAYVGVDVAVQGNKSLSVEATPLLSKAVYDAKSLVPNPGPAAAKSGILTIFDSWLKSTPSVADPKIPQIDSITGEGNAQSFLHALGVPSMDLQYTLTEADNEDFRHHREIAQFWAGLTWLLADSLIVPFDTRQYATFLSDSVNLISGRYKKEVKAHALPLLQLENAVQNFTTVAEAFHNKILHLDKSKPLEMRIMNDQQLQLERAFLHHHSTSTSSSPRHVVFSPRASVNVNGTAGFGALQDLLDDLVSSPVSSFVQTKVEDCLQSLLHCIISATRVLRIPLQPPLFY